MMSEQLHDFSIADMDLTMQEFITLIRNTKKRFGSKIPDIVKEYTKTVSGQINDSSLDMAYELIHEIFFLKQITLVRQMEKKFTLMIIIG